MVLRCHKKHYSNILFQPFSCLFAKKRPRTFVHLFVKSGCAVVVVNPNTFLLAAMEQSRSHLSTPVLSLCVGKRGGFLIERDTETSRTALSHTRKTWNRAFFFFSPPPLLWPWTFVSLPRRRKGKWAEAGIENIKNPSLLRPPSCCRGQKAMFSQPSFPISRRRRGKEGNCIFPSSHPPFSHIAKS